MMKRKFDHQLASDREEGLALKAVLEMAGKMPDEKADGSVVFCVGDCMMGTAGKGGKYASFQTFLVQKVRELGYLVVYRDEYLTSQKFPGLGYQTTFSGDNKIRIKFCPQPIESKFESFIDILVAEIKGLASPNYLSRDINAASQAAKKHPGSGSMRAEEVLLNNEQGNSEQNILRNERIKLAKEKLKKYQDKKLNSIPLNPIDSQKDAFVVQEEQRSGYLENHNQSFHQDSHPVEDQSYHQYQQGIEPEYTAAEYQDYINQLVREMEYLKYQLSAAFDSTGAPLENAQGLANSDANASLDLLRQDYSALEIELTQLKGEFTESQDVIANLNRLLHEKDAVHKRDLQRNLALIDELGKDVEHYKGLNAGLSQQALSRGDAEKKLKDLEASLEGSKDLKHGLEMRLEEALKLEQIQKNTIADLKAQIKRMETSLGGKASDLDRVASLLVESDKKLDQQQRLCASLENSLKQAQKTIETLNNSSSSPKSSPSTSVTALSGQLLQITERCRILQDENFNLIAKLEDLRLENTSLVDEKSQHDGKNAGLGTSSEKSLGASTISYPTPTSGSKMLRKTSDPRISTFAREADLMNQISSLTARLLALESEKNELTGTLKAQESTTQEVSSLESQNNLLKKELEKERRVTVLLQAEVDALPDMIELYHKERRALLQRINKQVLQQSVEEKADVDLQIKAAISPTLYIPCAECENELMVDI